MPTYDYHCDSCDHEFELFQSIKADPEKKCPECGKRKLRRLIGPGAAIVFKGSGFYKTDYRSDAYKSAASAEAKSNSSNGNGSAASKESGTKAASKSDGGGSSKN
jgi:putative FmdB family regulatory protein